MTLVVPGSAQLVAGNKRIGRIAIRIWMGLIATSVLLFLITLVWHKFAFKMAFNLGALDLVRLLMMGIAIGWAALFVDAWRLGQPLTLVKNQRLMAVGVNGVLCFTVAGTLLFGAHLVTVQRDFAAMFANGKVSDAEHGRYNVLLMGGDSGAGRWGLRPDSMTIASIDEETGRTVLIGLPRNLENFKFKKGSVMDEQFPDGFDCEGCYLNGVSTWAGDHTDLFGKSKSPGIDATIMAVEGITDLKINYWAMVNLQGFKDLVDAVGGVTVTVRDRIPVGGLGSDVTGYIEPGTRKLNGHDALWYARSREGSDDYSRMARQKCMMNAMATQVSPQKVVSNFGEIAEAGGSMIETNLPRSEFATFIDLALKAKDQKISSVSIVPPAINTADPDLAKIKAMVKKGIDKAEGKAGKPGKARKNASTNGAAIGTRDEGYAANASEDLAAAC
ncbi:MULTISPECIES: LCP family protein [unclassified Nocardioides]|uniref:LCP family protein n=1 Tax=unclassified Nocardioides TaxID=2615069 RepID=UPI001F34D820|nr:MULTISPECIES: LCP family protein [unclassified Nocardioides]